MKMQKDQLTARQRLFCEKSGVHFRHCAALAARLAGYAPGCSHVTGCQLLKKPKIAATVRGLEEALAQEIGVSRQKVIAQLVGAADLARELREPGAMISAYRNVAQICGYMNHKGRDTVAPTGAGDNVVMERLQGMSDAELAALARMGTTA